MCFIGCRVSYLLLNGCNFSKAFTFIRCSVDKKDDLSNDTKAYYVSKNEIGEITSQEIKNVVSHNTINGLFSVQVSEVIEKMNLKQSQVKILFFCYVNNFLLYSSIICLWCNEFTKVIVHHFAIF